MNYLDSNLSLCPSCHCMTKTIIVYNPDKLIRKCGKCEAIKVKRCLKCKNSCIDIDGRICGVTGLNHSNIKKCCFPKQFKEWELQAKIAGYWLKAEKMVAMT